MPDEFIPPQPEFTSMERLRARLLVNAKTLDDVYDFEDACNAVAKQIGVNNPNYERLVEVLYNKMDKLETCFFSVSKDAFGNTMLTIDVSDAAPNSPPEVSTYLDEVEARLLIKQLYEAFPSIETPAQALHKGYERAKAHIQFPVCACHFADDEETLLSPCLAHLEWAKTIEP